jgi:hypothetical protein
MCIRVKFTLEQAIKFQRGSRGIAVLVLEPRNEVGVGGQRHASATLPPGKEPRYAFYRKLGGPQGRSGQLRKILPLSGFDSQTVQPLASRYTVYDLWPPKMCINIVNVQYHVIKYYQNLSSLSSTSVTS